MSWFENPGAYREAQNRIREQQESESQIVEKKREDFEMGKEKVYKKKKLDVFELKRKIETGQSLLSLKDDIRQALDQGDISFETYRKALDTIQNTETKEAPLDSLFFIDPSTIPLSQNQLAQYLEGKRLWENIFIDLGWMIYGFAQGSTFLLFLLGRMVLDFLLLPRDMYQSFHQ